MNIVVTGSNGQLGHEFQHLSKESQFTFHFLSRKDLDITDARSIEDQLVKINPDVIINCAAYTAVDRAETDRENAFLINEKGPLYLAQYCKNHSCLLIHYSTDYVYHLDVDRPLREDDQCAPKSIYGKSKRAGEEAISSTECEHLIIRVSWLYSSFKNNFVKTMLRLGAERDSLSVVADQIGTPTYARDLAADTLQIISQYDNSGKTTSGIFNYSNTGITNWMDFAKAIFNKSKIECDVQSTTTASYGAPAPRPLWSVMSKEKIKTDFDIILRPWEESLDSCLEELQTMA